MPQSARSHDRRHSRPPIAPLESDQLGPALELIEAAQELWSPEDVPGMLAVLSRQLTEWLSASACLISPLDDAGAAIRGRAGYARPPLGWPRSADEQPLSDRPLAAAVLRRGEPVTCTLDLGRSDRVEAARLREHGYRSLLMLPLRVEGSSYALIEVFDRRARSFSEAEVRLAQALAGEAGEAVARARMQERLEDAYFATMGALAAALEAKDAYTNDHANQIAELAGAVCEQLGVEPAEARMIRLAALLHDIGKIGIPERILHKPGALTAEELDVMREHPDIGARILEPVPYFAQLVPLVRASHERFDGGGYPGGKRGSAIPLGSRVIAVCDAFHAMTEDRVYRPAMPVERAIAEIQQCSGSQFDPRCVEALLEVLRSQAWPRVTRDRVVRLARD
jgi:putative nucleotidyltransferase with HDIG domain